MLFPHIAAISVLHKTIKIKYSWFQKWTTDRNILLVSPKMTKIYYSFYRRTKISLVHIAHQWVIVLNLVLTKKNTHTPSHPHTHTYYFVSNTKNCMLACCVVLISNTKISFVLPSFCLFNLFRAIKKDENAVSSSHTKWQRYRFFYLFYKESASLNRLSKFSFNYYYIQWNYKNTNL